MRRIYHVAGVLFVLALLTMGWWWGRTGRVEAPSSVAGAPAGVTAAIGSVPAPEALAPPVPGSAPPARVGAPRTATTVPVSATLARLTYGQGWDADLPAAFAAFRDWTVRYAKAAGPAERAALEGEGLALARARRGAMKELIARDPRAALAATVPAALRPQLPPSVVAELETRFSVIGDFTVLAFDYGPMDLIRRKQMGLPTEPFQPFVHWAGTAETRAYVYGRREGQTTKQAIPLQGVVLDGVAALHESAVRVLESGETPEARAALVDVPASTATVAVAATVVAEIGGKLYRFATAADLLLAEAKLAAAEAGIGPQQIPTVDSVVLSAANSTGTRGSTTLALPPTAYTVGNKKIIVIRIDFPDLTGEPKYRGTIYTPAYVQDIADAQVNPFYVQSSYGATSLTTTVTTQVYRMPQPAAAYAVGNLHVTLHADARTAAAAHYTLASYDRIVVLFSDLGSIAGSQITFGGLADIGGPNVWINGAFDFRVVAHELGHTYGLFHANLWMVTDGNPVSATGTSTEYGDDFDVMGGNSANDQRADFNAWFKHRLGWVADSQVQTITSTGTYRVNRFDHSTGSGTLALVIPRDDTRNTWIGARRRFTTNATMQHGAYVIWGYNTNAQSNILDLTTPGTHVNDAALAIGSTLLDTVGNFSIKPVAEGGTAPHEYLDVLVTVGLNGLPVISAHPQSQGYTVGASVTLSVTATGNAPLAYQWRKHGTDLPGATATTFAIAHAQASDAGNYTVQVSNSIATIVSNVAVIGVNVSPGIAVPPVNVTTSVGFPVTLSVVPSGFPAPIFQWRKATVNIPGATAGAYGIINPQAADAGTYDVVVTNSLGTATSAPVSLLVNAVAIPPANDHFATAWILPGNNGFSQSASAGATGETGEPTHLVANGTASSVWYRWTPTLTGTAQIDTIGSNFDTVLAVYTGTALTALTQIAQDDDGGGATTGKLLIPVVAGTTYRIAVGDFGSAHTGGFVKLNYAVAVAPVVSTQPVSVVSTVGGAAVFSSGATGTSPTFQWYRNGLALPGATGATLSLGNLQTIDAGSYYVTVSNLAGTVSSSKVTLGGAAPPPTISVQPANVIGTSGQSATLSVTATGTGTLTYQWRRNGFPITGATAGSYTLGTATRLDADCYDVIAFAGLSGTPSQPARLSVAPTAYPSLIAPYSSADLLAEATGVGSNAGYAIAPLADGRAYIAGSFSKIDGTRRTGVARLNADGSHDTTFAPPELDNTVRALAVQSDGKLIVGGDFIRVGGLVRNRLVRLNTDGSLDPTFNPGTAVNASVLAMLVQPDQKILVGGSFTGLAGTTRDFFVRLNADGSVDTGFLTLGVTNTVSALALQSDGKILVGGSFTGGYSDINGNVTPRTRLARLNADGTLDTAFVTTASGTVSALAVQTDGKIVLGGAFASVTGTAVGRIARLNADAAGTVDTAFTTALGAPFPSTVNAIAFQADAKILIATANLVTRLNSDGSRDLGYLTMGVNGTVNTVAVQASGKGLMGGFFSTHTSFSNVVTNRAKFAQLNADGSLSNAVNFVIHAPGTINALLPLAGGKTLITGFFDSVRNAAVPTGLVLVDAAGTPDESFNFGGFGANDSVLTAVAQPDGKIVIGGIFTTYNGSTANRLARLNADGTLDATFNPSGGLNATAYTVRLLPGGRIFVAGAFTTAGGLTRNRAVVFNSDGSVDPSFDPGMGPGASVYTSTLQPDGKIIIGGSFTTYAGTSANRLARVHANGTLDTSFVTTVGANSAVYSVAVQPDGKVVFGGFFTSYAAAGAPVARSGVARVSGTDGSLDPLFVPPMLGQVYSLLLQEDGRVLIRGSFASAAGAIGAANVARLGADGTSDTTFRSAAFAPSTVFPSVLVMRDNGQLLMQSNGVSGVNATQPAAEPAITTQPLSQGVVAGTTATLSVIARSVLPLTYQWSFHTTLIATGTAATLAIPNFQATNAGIYTVVVTNELGSTPSNSAVLAVGTATPVAITTQPAAPTLHAGANATFTVVATGTPTPNYLWQRQPAGTTGFSNLTDTGAYSGATTATLTVTAATVAMRGDQFQCVVSNSAGASVTSAAVALTVNVPATITSANSATVTVNQALNFTVTATGLPAPTFGVTAGSFPAWAVLNPTSGVLSGVPPSTVGSPLSFTISASNGVAPAATQNFTLIVLAVPVAPVITTPPVAQVVPVGGTLKLSVVATGTPAPNYEWRRNTVSITNETSPTFTRANAQLADAGSYTVLVSNSAGNVMSLPVTVSVIPTGTSAQHTIVRRGYTAGGTVTLRSTLTYPGAATTAAWSVLLPAGWSFASSTGDAGATKPTVGAINVLDWTWATPPASPITFTYLLNVPAGVSGTYPLTASVTWVQSGTTIPLLGLPAPLMVAAASTRHAADSDGDSRISLIELTRMIELYNVRHGTVRTGSYKVDATTEDAFTSDPTRPGIAVLAPFHTADTNADALIGLIELTRVIELYNVRAGTARTGAYRVQAGSEDGFAPGPG